MPIALRKASLDLFSADEVAIVTEVLDVFRKNNAKEISDLSHQFDGWKLAKDGEDIPYEVCWSNLKNRASKISKWPSICRTELAALRADEER